MLATKSYARLLISDEEDVPGGCCVRLDELSDERYFGLLLRIREHAGPIGSGGLALAMQSDGLMISEATVGRMLKQMEAWRLLSKRSRGRILTPYGEQALRQLESRNAYMNRGRALQNLLQSADRAHIMQVMEVRRAVEGEAAAIAATRATDQEIVEIERIVEISRDHITKGTYSAEDDDEFHAAIVCASRNGVMEMVVRLIRESEGVSRVLMQIRQRVGRKSLDDHEAILLGVQSRDPDRARAAMLAHIERVRLDAIQVWAEIDAVRRGDDAPGFGE